MSVCILCSFLTLIDEQGMHFLSRFNLRDIRNMEPIYEGKAKRLYTTDDPNVLRMEYKDDATAGNGEKKAQFENKGKFNKAITLLIYKMLEDKGVKTHLIADVDEINIDVKKVSILKLEVIVRNIAAGSFSKRMGIKEGTPFQKPIVEFSYKEDALGDPFINDDYARELGAATEEECEYLRMQARLVNDVLIEFFQKVGLKLVDFKIEFGRLAENPAQIVLADEISPDTCRLWDMKTGEKMDKDRFRQDLGGLMDAYAEVLSRLEKNA
ncbi:MAG: phosphoribosylaminoimidazolesuccinocarboxamide synthase [Akkermansia sp.]